MWRRRCLHASHQDRAEPEISSVQEEIPPPDEVQSVPEILLPVPHWKLSESHNPILQTFLISANGYNLPMHPDKTETKKETPLTQPGCL